MKGLVVGLQEEVLNLKTGKALPPPEDEALLNAQGESEDQSEAELADELVAIESVEDEDLQEEPEKDPAPIFQVEPEPVPELPPIEYDDSAGPFKPFDPDNFAEDFVSALEDPLPVDWSGWIDDESAEELVGSFVDEELEKGLEVLAENHASLIEQVLAFNSENPPDFVQETPFNKLAESLTEKPFDFAAASTTGSVSLPTASAHDIMAELVAEAIQGQAVEAVDGSFEPEPPVALAEIFPQSLIESPDGYSNLTVSSEDSTAKPSPEVLAQIPALAAIRACLLPLSIEGGVVTCGVPKPIDFDAIKLFEEETGLRVSMNPMGLLEVVHGLREGYATKDEENYRASLLSGAAPPEPITLKERVLASIPFLKAEQ